MINQEPFDSRAMFNDKPYFKVNREERFYVALFAHALLSSQIVRERFSDLIQSKYGINLNPSFFEVFLEVAALRDYWNDLGDPVAYTADTHSRRRAIIESILEMFELLPTVIDQHDFFWTSPERRKLWSPGRWDIAKVKEAGLEKLVKVRWAFNAKPDMLIVSGGNALMIEAKLESGEGGNDETGYRQYEIQALSLELWKRLIPSFSRMEVKRLELSRTTKDGILWSDIQGIIEGSNIDEFTMRCVIRL